MDLTQQQEPTFSKQEQKFKSRLEKILAHQDLTLQRHLIERVTKQLGIEVIDCAAALVVLSQSNLYHGQATKQPATKIEAAVVLQPLPLPKMIRYRIDVGQKHQVTIDEIKSVFIAEAGVDKKMIGEVDIRYHYTLIELPEGMPADIYQLLTTVSIQQQKLNIKRLKHRDRYASFLPRKNKA